jgi:hypothetical protein
MAACCAMKSRSAMSFGVRPPTCSTAEAAVLGNGSAGSPFQGRNSGVSTVA